MKVPYLENLSSITTILANSSDLGKPITKSMDTLSHDVLEWEKVAIIQPESSTLPCIVDTLDKFLHRS